MARSRREFLKAGVVTAGTGLAGLAPAQTPSPRALAPAPRESNPAKRAFSISIREYLSREARRITNHALADYKDAATWRRLLPERRRQYLEMMRLENFPPQGQRPPLNVKVTGVVERSEYRIEKLYYESLPQAYVTANLYVPNKLVSRAPGVLYVCGHSPTQKTHYQAHPRRFAELGFVCLIVDTVQYGEARGFHHGPYYEGWQHWYSRGYSPAAIEMLNGIRGLDLLSERPEVDGARLGVTGISGGGATSWWVAAGDERVKVAAPVCGTATLGSHLEDLTIDGHCDCMWWNNTYLWDLADVGGLIAPQPLLIASANHDSIFTIDAIREVHSQLQRLYTMLGAAQNLRLVETPGGHGYHKPSRTAIFSWFLKHLAGKVVSPEQVGDIDDSPERQESEETLRVFLVGSPPENRTPSIHEGFISLPKAAKIADHRALGQARQQTISALRAKTFRAFPVTPPLLATQVEFEFANDGNQNSCRFGFTAEQGWRLHGELLMSGSTNPPVPAVVALRSPGERRPDGVVGSSEEFLGRIRVPWAKVVVEPRGTGETSWGEELQWHLRRAAAWTGRTLASMWVYDALRALDAVRSLPHVQGKPVALAGRGPMAAVALYAALLEGHVSTLFLESPPASQNLAGQRDGSGPAIEMLNCLRITDLAQVAGLLFPTELVFIGDCPSTYDWAEELYRRLGMADRFRRVGDLTTWSAG
jgi:cephalosporin-C deacetylase-like acetyl esterase